MLRVSVPLQQPPPIEPPTHSPHLPFSVCAIDVLRVYQCLCRSHPDSFTTFAILMPLQQPPPIEPRTHSPHLPFSVCANQMYYECISAFAAATPDRATHSFTTFAILMSLQEPPPQESPTHSPHLLFSVCANQMYYECISAFAAATPDRATHSFTTFAILMPLQQPPPIEPPTHSPHLPFSVCANQMYCECISAFAAATPDRATHSFTTFAILMPLQQPPPIEPPTHSPNLPFSVCANQMYCECISAFAAATPDRVTHSFTTATWKVVNDELGNSKSSNNPIILTDGDVAIRTLTDVERKFNEYFVSVGNQLSQLASFYSALEYVANVPALQQLDKPSLFLFEPTTMAEVLSSISKLGNEVEWVGWGYI
ncbi:hypothetical protein J6590_062588 [Homalodisca vitripennis]|nr:hypothetical protein J6590_062588 [Homalodisca vitripennis]